MGKVLLSFWIAVLIALPLCFCSAQVDLVSPGWPDDAQSTTGPVPPYQAAFEIIPPAMTSQKLISGVPPYSWYRGCGPTAVGMVLGYWDGKGFANLVAGSASTQTSAANLMMSSSGNYNDYCFPIDSSPNLLPDKSEPPVGDEHPNDCVADFMYTSQSVKGNYYGWSWYSDVPTSFSGYVQLAEPSCGFTTSNRSFGSLSWGMFCAEIDAGRPVVFLVDSNSDGATDHFVTVIGYGVSNGVNMYACYDTWSSSVRWCNYLAMASGRSFGVYGATLFNIAQPADQVLMARNSPTGCSIVLKAVPVSAAFSSFFYIEDTDRSCGIRVAKTNHGLQKGMLVDITGSVQINSDGEKYISASTAVRKGMDKVVPVGFTNRNIGGADWNLNTLTNAGQAGVSGAVGLNNIGMLVCTTGRVTYSTSNYFYIDDGSHLNDNSGKIGLKVVSTGLTSPYTNSYAQVTGISSCYKGTDGQYHPQVLVPSQEDIIHR